MFKFCLRLSNPYHNEKIFPFRSLYNKFVRVSKNRTLEFQVNFFFNTLFEFSLDTIWRGRDHAGPELELTVLGLTFTLSLPDNRHWNYDKNDWYKYGEEELDE